MKYIVTKFENCDEVLSSYCQRNAHALVAKDENFTKIYIDTKTILSLEKYKKFCICTLPFVRSKKPSLEFYKAKVEFPRLIYAELLFGVKSSPWAITNQLKLESSVQVNKYCFLYSRKGVNKT